MKLIFAFFIFTFSISAQGKTNPSVKYDPKDKEILSEIFTKYGNQNKASTAELVVLIGKYFLETPYVAHTLEMEPEQLVVNLRELDCTTFVENCLAISRTIKSGELSFEKFCAELQNIRYHNGRIDNYTSRIHYFSDWIYENDKRNIVKDVSQEIANSPYPLHVNFMSTHPESYAQLKDASLIPVIAKQEKEISSRSMFYIPEEKLAEVEKDLIDGDIAGITTTIQGMDISHVVILIKKEGRVHLLHASSAAMKVMISENTLEDYLKSSKSATGIMVARPK